MMVDFTDREEELAEVLPSEPARPKKITIVVVIAIILAVLYLMGFLGTIPGLIMHVVSPGGFNFAPADSDDPQLRMQAELQANMAAVTQNYFIPLVLLSLATLAVGSFLLYSSIQVLRRGELSDYRLLNNSMIFAIMLVIINSIATVLIQMANWDAINRAFMSDRVVPQAELMRNIMMFSMVLGIGMGVAFELGKLIYFLIARWILGHYIATRDQS